MRIWVCLALGAACHAADQKLIDGLKYRTIGPFRGGRVIAVAGSVAQPSTYYFGATGGGIWKTTDSGETWNPVPAEAFGTGTVGALQVADSDANVIYAGMGEACVRGNVSHGDGMYKSVDAGSTWKRIGLEDTRHISRIRIHPKNPDIVYVAALGHIFGPNEQRGVFRSRDGGATWQRVLHKSANAGGVDLAMDPSNPNILYAALWHVRRGAWFFESGGPDSGLYKSTDGGDSWQEISRQEGLPKGVLGRIGVAVSPVNPQRVWAMVEADDGGVFRSDNGGRTFTRVNQERNLRQRAWYYTHIFADPQVADRVYVLNVNFFRSNDGGRTFQQIATPHGDNHDLWIASNNSNRMIGGDDGGAHVSDDGGRRWTGQNQPTAQFYRVTTDDEFPYNIYGAQQDNTTVRIASRTASSGIGANAWWAVGGGESGWIAPSPANANVVFAGSYDGLLTRYDHITGQLRNITVWPDNPMGSGVEAMKFRFQWNFPILFSPHDPKLLYTAGNVVFKSANEGANWQPVSPDLTRNDRSKMGPTGGPITKDNTSVEYYGTIFTMMESPVAKGVIWTGSDDGLVHVTRNGGGAWSKATPHDLPEWAQINSLEASPHEAGVAYIAATLYKFDDFRPLLYKTADYGRTWTKIVTGLPEGSFTRVIREDPHRRGLLYTGTETGLHVSFDDGAHWQPLQLNLPRVPITDLAVHKRERDLVVATQGRGFWVLDDLAVLHQLKDSTHTEPVTLFAPEEGYRMASVSGRGTGGAGQNPPAGLVVHYHLRAKPDVSKNEVKLEFLDAKGAVIRAFSTGDKPAAPEAAGGGDDEAPRAPAVRVPAEAGLNTFVWNLRHADAERFPGMILWAGNLNGPKISPGRYTVRLSAAGATLSQPFEVRKDPRIATTQAEFDSQFELAIQIRDKLTETHQAIIEIRDIRKQLDDFTARHKDLPAAQPAIKAGAAILARLKEIEEDLYQTRNQSSQDPLNYPIRLNNKLAALAGVVQSADAGPTAQAQQVREELVTAINARLARFRDLKRADLAQFNRLAAEAKIPAVAVK
ncbi:MAG: glycosyl hydrolase [Acidobacteria bacterium]|nr:glycosyl hydrolase [Acidobacteriota bacterium]